jgi:hypothetical protein
MAVKHTKVATVADDGTSEVGTNEWNDDHTIDNSTITNDHLAGSIANTKLATDPLARANHTGSQAQSTITDLTTDLSSKAPIASPTFTGTVTTASVDVAGNNIDNIQNIIHDISTTTTALDFNGDQLQTISISAATTFTTSNRAIGRSKTIKITTDGSTRAFTFPAWKFVGAKPADQAASKIGILTLTCFGTADTDCVAAYVVEE